MNTSPCAKLISSMIPYTRVYPMAIRAQIAPLDRPSGEIEAQQGQIVVDHRMACHA